MKDITIADRHHTTTTKVFLVLSRWQTWKLSLLLFVDKIRVHRQVGQSHRCTFYVVVQQVSLDLSGGGVWPEASHHHDQFLGFNLALPLAVVQRETLLKLCNTCTHTHTVMFSSLQIHIHWLMLISWTITMTQPQRDSHLKPWNFGFCFQKGQPCLLTIIILCN